MIARLLAGVARSLFTVACLFAFAALLAFYGCYRALRAATVGAKPQPVRAAGLELLVALVALARALKQAAPAGVPIPVDEPAPAAVAIPVEEEELAA